MSITDLKNGDKIELEDGTKGTFLKLNSWDSKLFYADINDNKKLFSIYELKGYY